MNIEKRASRQVKAGSSEDTPASPSRKTPLGPTRNIIGSRPKEEESSSSDDEPNVVSSGFSTIPRQSAFEAYLRSPYLKLLDSSSSDSEDEYVEREEKTKADPLRQSEGVSALGKVSGTGNTDFETRRRASLGDEWPKMLESGLRRRHTSHDLQGEVQETE